MNIPQHFNVPPVTRGVGLAFLTLTCLYTYTRVLRGNGVADSPSSSAGLPYLVLVPGLSWYMPWTWLTATFIDRHVFDLVISTLTLFFAGRYLERAWGSSEYTKFIILLAVGPNLLCAGLFILAYLITGSQNALYATINGTAALQAAFLVAFKQLIPEHTVDLFKSTIRIRVKHFPALFIILYTVLSPLMGALSSTILVWLGFVLSWVYLRFFRVNPSATLDEDDPISASRGDASDTFAFSHFFPDAVQAIIDPPCEVVYQFCLQAKIIAPFSSDAIAAAGPLSRQHAAERGAPVGSQKTLEAERRRNLALKALDQKLSGASASHAAIASEAAAAAAPSASDTSDFKPPAQSDKASDYS